MYKKIFLIGMLFFGTLHAFYSDTTPLFSGTLSPDFYIEIDAGVGGSLRSLSGSNNSGGNFNGKARQGKLKYSPVLGASCGYRLNPLFRTDLSYTFFNNPFKWETIFSAENPSVFHSTLHSHQILGNIYIHLEPILALFPGFDPYIGGGLGVVIHRMFATIERDPIMNNSFVSEIQSKTGTHFAASAGFGLMRRFLGVFQLDLAFFANYIERISSGSRRTFSSGAKEAIGPYVFRDIWVGSVTGGVKWEF